MPIRRLKTTDAPDLHRGEAPTVVAVVQGETDQLTEQLPAAGDGTDLVIAGERLGDVTGLELAAGLLSINPMITCAVVSGLTPEQFHEA